VGAALDIFLLTVPRLFLVARVRVLF
jgi:hypothetical protein